MVVAADLTSKQKVAVLLASMDQKVAASILQQLDSHVMAEVANSIRNLGVVSGDVRNECIAECVTGIMEIGNAVRGDEGVVNALLKTAIGEKRATALLLDKEASDGESFAFLASVSGEQIARILAKEQPSVVGIVLRFLAPEKAAEVLSVLASEVRKEAIVFVCTARLPAVEVVKDIEKYMESRITGERSNDSSSNVEEKSVSDVISGILQQIDSSIEEELLTAIEDKSEETANEIRDKLFTFEDIEKIDDVGIRRILQEIDTSLLAVALRNASIALREKFFGNMSKRAAEGVKEEMEFAQKIKLSDVLEKQKEIVGVIRGLDADGQISIGTSGKDEYV